MECKAAVLQVTKKSIDPEKDEIYVMKTQKSMKAYRGCSKKAIDCGIFCHSHSKQESPILFSEVMENGIRLHKDHPFLCKIGNGGRKSKKGIVVLKESSYIHKMLIDGTSDRKKLLETVAEFIFKLKENDESKLSKLKIAINKSTWTYDSDMENDFPKESAVLSNLNDEHIFSKNIDEPSMVSSSEASKNPVQDIESVLRDVLHFDENGETATLKAGVDDEDSLSEDEIECEEIHSKDGTTFYLDPNNMKVYNLDQEECGFLFKTDKKNNQIDYNGDSYTIVKDDYDGDTHTYTCIFTNKHVRELKPKKTLKNK